MWNPLILPPFALGLMAKPILVTLPFVLLLLDYWPLGRLQLNSLSILGGKSLSRSIPDLACSINSLSTLWGERAGVRGALWEKVPFLALLVISIYLSSLSVQRLGVVVKEEKGSKKKSIN